MTIQILELTNKDIDAILPLENELYHKPWLKKDYEYELNENPFAYYLKMIDKSHIHFYLHCILPHAVRYQ